MKTIILSIFIKIIIVILLIPVLYKIIVLGSDLPKVIIEKYGANANDNNNIQYLILAAKVAKNEADIAVNLIETAKSSNFRNTEEKLLIAHSAIKNAFNVFHNLYSSPIIISDTAHVDDDIPSSPDEDYPQPDQAVPTTLTTPATLTALAAPPVSTALITPATLTALAAPPASTALTTPATPLPSDSNSLSYSYISLSDVDLPKEVLLSATAMIKASQ